MTRTQSFTTSSSLQYFPSFWTKHTPVIHALVKPSHLMTGHCVIPCGTGLGLIFLQDTFLPGIAKPGSTIPLFTEFGGWRNAKHVANYAHVFTDLKNHDISALYERFPGRFRPI